MDAPVEIGLSAGLLAGAFPFHFVVDRSLVFVQTGAVLERVVGGLKGGQFGDRLKVVAPDVLPEFEAMREHSQSLFVYEVSPVRLILKGQMLYQADRDVLIFLGSPWITDAKRLMEFGLSMRDFAIHDPVTDFLFLLQSKNTALADAKSLAKKLMDKKASLRASRQTYRNLVEQLREVIFQTDREGACVYVNPAWTKITGFAEHETLGRKFADFVLPDSDEDGVETPVPPPLSAGLDWQSTLRCRTRASLPRVMEAYARPALDEQGVASGMAVTLHDITERRLAETALIASRQELERRVQERTVELMAANTLLKLEIEERERAERALQDERGTLAARVEERTSELAAVNAELARASRLKDEFLANMSHELRTPLNAILGLSESLLEQSYGPLNERQTTFLQNIEESGRHLLALINDILDLSKIESGKLEFDLQAVAPGEVCEASCRLVRQAALRKQQKLVMTVEPGAPEVLADERRLKQILVNLLSNAVKFTPERGSIGLEVGWDRARGALRFTVWDTGIGISPAGLQMLFKPFVQLDGGFARRHEGTGLGLALVYRLTETQKGSITVESTVGAGSRFTVTLPARETATPAEQASQPPPAPAVAPAIAPLPGQGFTLLVAEDNDLNIKVLRPYLQNLGYRVELARDGVEAVDAATRTKPDLILMDVQMPRMDGLEATRRLRATPGLATVPIIALTALAMPGDQERCLAAGMNEYVSKPFRLHLLAEAITRLLKPVPHRARLKTINTCLPKPRY